MAITTVLRGFKDFGRSLTPIFLLIAHFFYVLEQKMKKIYRLEVGVFLQNALI